MEHYFCCCIFWKLAIVSELLKGADNKVWAAVVKVVDPQGGHKLLRRSIIEVSQEQDSQLQGQGGVISTPQTDNQGSSSSSEGNDCDQYPQSITSNSLEDHDGKLLCLDRKFVEDVITSSYRTFFIFVCVCVYANI